MRAVGRRSAKLNTLTDYVAQVRRIFLKRDGAIPVYIAASGPKASEAEDRIGNGAIVSGGTHPSLVSRAFEYIERGGRDENWPTSTLCSWPGCRSPTVGKRPSEMRLF